MINTFNLHIIEESKQQLVNYNENIAYEEQNQKIKLTYKSAIEEIYQLSFNPEYRKYFHKILNEPLEGDASLIGAAVDKVSANIFVIVKNQSGGTASVLQWSPEANWNIGNSLMYKEAISNDKTNKKTRGYEGYNFFTYFYTFINKKISDLQNKDHEYIKGCLWTGNKYFVPIAQDYEGQYATIIGALGCYTIDYQDIVDWFKVSSIKLKNPYKTFSLEA